MNHTDVQDLLAEYSYSLITEEPPLPATAAIEAHLDGCSACQIDLALLVDAAVTTYHGLLELSPLAGPVPQPGRLQQWVIQFSEALLATLQPRELAAAFRDSSDPRGPMRYSYFYKHADEHAPEVTIEVYDNRTTADLTVVDVFIQLPWRSPVDQEGTNVLLHMPASEVKGTTDACGYVSFPAIPRAAIGRMQIEISA